jgi:lysyl-tRNA synthetase, class II
VFVLTSLQRQSSSYKTNYLSTYTDIRVSRFKKVSSQIWRKAFKKEPTYTLMPSEQELIDERVRKIDTLRQRGINPYPYKFIVTTKSDELHTKYDKLKPQDETQDKVSVAGRVMGLRRMGKIAFIHLQDGQGKIQTYLAKDSLEDYNALKQLDRGDFLGVEGTIFKTKTGEITVKAEKFVILSKAIRPLPEKYHGLKDKEIRYRKRYLDMIMNPDVKKALLARTTVMDTIRHVLNNKGFLEVETPILHSIYGGASARPFKSHLNALDMPVYMRVSNELFLKRLLIGGIEKVYEFSKDFRNEGTDRTHNPEFTQIEIYEAYVDLYDIMTLCEDVFRAAAKSLGSTTITFSDHEIDLAKPFVRITMMDAIKKYGNIDVKDMSEADLQTEVKKLKLKPANNKGMMILQLFEELAESKLIQPTFVTEHPVETTPLAKTSRENPDLVERFELFIAGTEYGNAYSELNDPIKQRELLEAQAKELRGGDDEAHPMDEDFVEAMEYGMPPAGGIGIGIDRMIMLLCNKDSIRDVIFFPFMKPVDKE